MTALSVSVFGGRIDKLTQAFVALEERVEDGNKALTKVSDALSGMSESLDVLVSKRLRVGPLHTLPLPALTRPCSSSWPTWRSSSSSQRIGVTPVPVIMSLSAPRRALLVTLVSAQYFLEKLKLKLLIFGEMIKFARNNYHYLCCPLL